jgi:hypothetical protein
MSGATFYTPGSDAERFVEETEANGLVTEHYHGRFWYEGPAVRAADDHEFQLVLRSTTVPVQWDSLGLGYIVYPRRGDNGLSETGTVEPREPYDEDDEEDF